MMDFRQRLEQSRTKPVDGIELVEPDEDIVCQYFAADRTKSPACLELRLSNGKRKALPYAYFSEISFDVEEGIEIITGVKKITITGRNLTQLFDQLITYRVRFVQADIGNDTREDGLFVKEIQISELDS